MYIALVSMIASDDVLTIDKKLKLFQKPKILLSWITITGSRSTAEGRNSAGVTKGRGLFQF